jgi:hypothetical protein
MPSCSARQGSAAGSAPLGLLRLTMPTPVLMAMDERVIRQAPRQAAGWQFQGRRTGWPGGGLPGRGRPAAACSSQRARAVTATSFSAWQRAMSQAVGNRAR